LQNAIQPRPSGKGNFSHGKKPLKKPEIQAVLPDGHLDGVEQPSQRNHYEK
jgi:hypothetical protein